MPVVTAKPVIPMSPQVKQRTAQEWINNPKSGMGGMDSYVAKQNARYAGADEATRNALIADSQRVGYTLTGGGVTGGGVEVGSKTGQGTGASVNTGSAAIPSSSNDPNFDKAQGYIDYLGNMQPFKYDVNSDASYQALKESNMANAKVANRDMEEEMNSRGILNSTVTSDRSTEIYKQGADATTSAIPQLQANAYNQYQNEYNNKLGLANQYLSLSNNTFERGMKNFDKEMKIADTTGQYMAPEVHSLIQTVLDAKANFGKPGVDKQALTQAAEIARGKLSEYGIDPKLFGSNVTLAQAQANVAKAFQPTMAAQQGNANLITGIAGNYPSIPFGTGDALKKGAPALGNAATLIKSLEGMKTLPGLTQEQRNWIDQEQLKISRSSNNTSASNNSLGWAKFGQDNLDATAEKERMVATNGVVTNLLSSKTRADAYAYLEKYQDELSNDGIDVQTLYNEIAKDHYLWDKDKNKQTPSSGPSVYDKVLGN